MRNVLACAVLMVLSLNSMAQGTQTLQVQVHFDHPEHFRDARLDRAGYARGADDYVLKTLTHHLQKLGQRYLQPGQQLVIDIHDIDLAGGFEPWHVNAYNVRFMRETTWPTIDLSYTFSQPGKPDQHAQERVSDKMYLSRPGRVASSSERLYAEKAMLADWFRQRFAAQPAS